MELSGCLKLSVPKNVATKEPVDLHFITIRLTFLCQKYNTLFLPTVTNCCNLILGLNFMLTDNCDKTATKRKFTK